MTTTFAADKAPEVNHTYEINYNVNVMSRALNLTSDQTRKVAEGQATFQEETRKANRMDSAADRQARFDYAVLRNVKYMKSVLNKEQFHKYLMLLNVTINNRGLNK